MATYKVLQDIEAEDTLIGPLTLRQCIYAAIAIVAIYLSVVFVSKHVAFMVFFTLPFIAFGIFFAFPWSKQQTTEVWALAKIRFILKPRKRIWNQSGVKELVTITVPKNLKRAYASTLTPVEVSSRLKALADTIDSRGWAIKNVDMGYYKKPTLLGGSASDRLVDQSSLPQEVSSDETSASEDIFDVQNNPVAQKFDAMMAQSADAHRQQLVQQMSQPTQQPTAQSVAGQPALSTAGPLPQSYWHMRTISPLPDVSDTPAYSGPAMSLPAPVRPGQSIYATPTMPTPLATAAVVQGTPAAAPDLSMRAPSIQPPAAPIAPAASPLQPATTPQNQMTEHANPAILELANNNDLDIATIAREAQARNPDVNGEVTVSLH